MSKVYLKANLVEQDEAKQLPRLLGIVNEIFEDYTMNTLGNTNYNCRTTKYCEHRIIERYVEVLDENDEPVLDMMGNPTQRKEIALELDTELAEYGKLAQVHVNRLVSAETMEADGWVL